MLSKQSNTPRGDKTQSEPNGKQARRRRLVQQWHTLHTFVHKELWDLDLSTLPRIKKFGVSLVRIAAIVGKGLIDDKCALQSAALSYITLVSLVPVLALSFAVSRGLGAHGRIMEIIKENLEQLPENVAVFVQQVLDLVERVNYGALGTVGLLVVFLSAVGMLAKIESSFNTIWGIQSARTTFRKFTDYISVLVVVPILMLLATSINTALSTGGFATFLEQNLGSFYWIYQDLIGFSSIVALCLAFAFLYMFMPNTSVKVGPALLGGLAAGILWFLAQRIYIEWQVGVTRMNAIYGTFAALPFFLSWLYVSWLIVLFGAEISFGIQNLATFVAERESVNASLATRELLGLTATYCTCRSFMTDDKPWNARTFARQNNIASRLMTDVMHTLTREGILIGIEGDDRETEYVPARDAARLCMRDVVNAFHGHPEEPAETAARQHAEPAYQKFTPAQEAMRGELGETNFRSLIEDNSPCNTASP